MKRLPFFVYGTLIPNQPNYYLWEKSIINTESGLLKNYQLFDMGHYPMIVESKGSNVEGILIEIKEEHYENVTNIIDNLEGYEPEKHGNSAYTREIRRIDLENGNVRDAWIYIGSEDYIKKENIVKGGNWVKHIKQKKQNQQWWENVNTVQGLDKKTNEK